MTEPEEWTKGEKNRKLKRTNDIENINEGWDRINNNIEAAATEALGTRSHTQKDK